MIFVAALFALAAPLAAYGDWIPPDLPAGAKYEIAFVTSGGTTATDPYEADYNAFVTAQARQNPNLPQGVTWHAIASTFENGDVQAAYQNAPYYPYDPSVTYPVYNTQGQLVANALPVYNAQGQIIASIATPLYSPSGSILNPIGYDQFGNAQNTLVWTGSEFDGTYDNPLGNGIVYGAPDIGYSGTTSDWLSWSPNASPTNVSSPKFRYIGQFAVSRS